MSGATRTINAGHHTDPVHYFIDLRAVTLLVCSTWPVARHLSPSGETANATDHHIQALQERNARALARAINARARPREFDTPPADAAASAGLLHIADRILLSGGPDEVRE